MEPKPKLNEGFDAIDAYKESIKMVSKSNLSKEKLATFVKSTKEKMKKINDRIEKLNSTERYSKFMIMDITFDSNLHQKWKLKYFVFYLTF